jgi:hypothetical protein
MLRWWSQIVTDGTVENHAAAEALYQHIRRPVMAIDREWAS